MVELYQVEREELLSKAELLKVLGHPERLAIVLLTMDGERCVKELVEALGISQPKVSQHVGLMKELGILTFRKEGTKVLYRVNDRKVREIVEVLFGEE
ncbi:ArsR/SmtB family transcription factor [Thermovibrio ammonificans]|jgi:ArsR family transcriptional regulator|uniref:Regulatory protein ArsR n=1 Tax=Thermovibrio ammonificans (strain DSM 15698 / JCM 12110 / HB-1) TaxID=648996 RepID=E8T2J1_THEA1|nr:metalloregulator ArsR/SmtB family transcription factor [Thermovibrio ammonificans]ADU97086.1 regulatory protein ArsR [Thermovibrio ammonificans HB-1]